ncbi:Lipoprotein-releasing system ATP-binding protein LolD [Fundidesulfovibrio magnetotacticus]|uniref:Lipoprotein-releasing system ATP-binding protein LolD n=1 Tax=Fundidesulfovibrio magnetotacticus TaxID=2730080 RepID=A0A6V8LKU1_9BACT|nr:ABC transporter ATP-binding protein [Fundidesulfovibrio magnetotacticus]GFK93313.1 Lipoprotein-releasing system ATP-binding protein LolD [Fundidesulfovibrio magnetotacticus]
MNEPRNRPAPEPLYALRGVGKDYEGPGGAVTVLDALDLDIAQGESLAILGSSGSGKSTLLHLLGALDTPSRGNVRFDGQDLSTLRPWAAAKLRNFDIGFVFQFHHLLPEFTTLENAAMPGLIAGLPAEESQEKARRALGLLGLEQRLHHRVTTLSGGERQRAAIARAILMGPKALLADEPTGNLDEATGQRVGELLANLNAELGMTLVVVTHNHNLARLMGRRMELHGGELTARP